MNLETYKPHALPPAKKTKSKRWWWFGVGVPLGLVVLCLTILFFPLSTRNKVVYVYIDTDDTTDSVFRKTELVAKPYTLAPFRLLALTLDYASHIHTGCYALPPRTGSFFFLRALLKGRQEPVRLTVPVVREIGQMAERLSSKLMGSKQEWEASFADTALLATYGVTPATLPTLFVPNTYEVYWNITPQKFLARMAQEHNRFWTESRKKKAQVAGFTPEEIITLASIVEQETTYKPEKPTVAGMYINRLRQGMKLQADPTVKFAVGNFALQRILFEHLKTDSPYNTYLYEGLPPGPIGVPSVESVDAVLNYDRHNYVFMCAKEDFSGAHNFAVTYAEHQQNAKRYTDALNARGIR